MSPYQEVQSSVTLSRSRGSQMPPRGLASILLRSHPVQVVPVSPSGHQVATIAPGIKLTNSIYAKQKKTDGEMRPSPLSPFTRGRKSFPDAPRRSTYTSVQNIGRPQRQALDKARSASMLFRKGLQETSAGEHQGVRLGGKAASKGCVNWLPL